MLIPGTTSNGEIDNAVSAPASLRVNTPTLLGASCADFPGEAIGTSRHARCDAWKRHRMWIGNGTVDVARADGLLLSWRAV